MSKTAKCQLCFPKHENIIFTNDLFRVIHVGDEYYPGYIRIILNEHAIEMTDIDMESANRIFSALLIIERQIRNILNPDKINLASFGNMVPHLHWHIIPRYKNDRHFPNPIWGDIVNAKYRISNDLIHFEQQLINSISNQQHLFAVDSN
jgi:diadenosine tetraphosphate (Ap4A) HIT family hydrolase